MSTNKVLETAEWKLVAKHFPLRLPEIEELKKAIEALTAKKLPGHTCLGAGPPSHRGCAICDDYYRSAT